MIINISLLVKGLKENASSPDLFHQKFFCHKYILTQLKTKYQVKRTSLHYVCLLAKASETVQNNGLGKSVFFKAPEIFLVF